MSSIPFGEHLKREREMRGVSIEEIAAATRISPRFLEALENERWEQLPGGAFNRGFIRSVARFLGMDEDGLVAEYALDTGNGSSPAAVPLRTSRPVPKPWFTLVVAALVLAVLLMGGWFVVSRYGPAIKSKLLHRHANAGSSFSSALVPSAPRAGGPH
jgi:cytoskeletal protein RodZ